MKFKVPKSKLLESLNTVQNVAGKNSVPILTNVLIVANDNTLTFTTTDLDITITCSCAAEVEQEGKCALPVKKLASIVRELGDGMVSIAVDTADNSAHMKCGSYKSKLLGRDPAEFPPAPTTEGSISYTLDEGRFRDMLKKTHYAASTDDSRPILNGVLMNFADGKLTCVATDGRRLALYETEVEFPAENNKDVVLPIRAVTELSRLLSEEGELTISLKDQQLIFEFDDMFFACKLLSGIYPNYKQVVFSSCDNRIELNREELLAVLRRIAVSTTPTTNAMRLNFENNILTMTVSAPDVGEATDTVAIKYDGPPLNVIFNPEFMMDPLKNLTSDVVFIELNNSSSPGLIKSDIPFLYVIMPLRV